MHELMRRLRQGSHVGLLCMLLLFSCSDQPPSNARTGGTAITENESLVRTTWEVLEITDGEGRTYLPYDGRPDESEGRPTVEYDHNGHLARVSDGMHDYRADSSSNTFDISLLALGTRAAFPEEVRSVLFYGTPDRNGSNLTLIWASYSAKLALVAEERYSPTPSR